MKRMFSLAMSLSLLAMSLGPAAPQAAALAAARVTAKAPMAPMVVFPVLNMGIGSQTLSPSLAGAPLAALRATLTPTLLPAVEGTLTRRIYQSPDGTPTPFAASMQALAAEGPEFEGMDANTSRQASAADFQNRIGQASEVPAAPGGGPAEVELLVSAPEGSGRQMTESVYPAAFSMPAMSLANINTALNAQIEKLGIPPKILDTFHARAVGTVAPINTLVLKVPAYIAGLLQGVLEMQGLKVQEGRIFHVPAPMGIDPASRTVGLKEMAAVVGADKLQAELKKVLGEPVPPGNNKEVSLVSRAMNWLGRAMGLAVENPVLPWAILDTWVATGHPYIKDRFAKSVDNDPDSETHGTHTSGTVIGVDLWNYAGRNYNIFPGGSASEGDILFKLNMAQEDGALGTTNSWGDGAGNPEGAIEKLFIKGAEKGIHHSISAGNAGMGNRRNTIGGPAISYYNVDLVINGKVIGTVKRIKAIAASDSDKKTAYFSSRGPGSPTTARNPEQYKDYPLKPDESAVGVNLVAPVPSGDYVPELGGPGESMSGTSMSNPGDFGSFLLLTRGILVLLKDYLPVLPTAQQIQFALDLAGFAMTQTDEKVAPDTEVGDGFINVWSAFEFAAKILKDNAPGTTMPKVRSFLRGVLGFASAR